MKAVIVRSEFDLLDSLGISTLLGIRLARGSTRTGFDSVRDSTAALDVSLDALLHEYEASRARSNFHGLSLGSTIVPKRHSHELGRSYDGISATSRCVTRSLTTML